MSAGIPSVHTRMNLYALINLLTFRLIFFFILIFIQFRVLVAGNPSGHDLHFARIPSRWDEGLPLGNGMLGALVWQKGNALRIAVDRADLWDLRPVAEFALPQFRFAWVAEQVRKQNYDTVQRLFDLPYDRDPAPTRLPAGAIEFPVAGLGEVEYVRLMTTKACVEIRWKNGTVFRCFVDATQPIGRFQWKTPGTVPAIRLDPPPYGKSGSTADEGVVEGQGLNRLGYPQGTIRSTPNSLMYEQQGWGEFTYQLAVAWNERGTDGLEGCWSISSTGTPYSTSGKAIEAAEKALGVPFEEARVAHEAWWRGYWSRSSVHLPDSLLEKQWYLEMYKFGSASRRGAPPISLQAVWTADNGSLPPWKGDFHHDLNTQMSYWAGEGANHPEESAVFTDWIWMNREQAFDYTHTYFESPGLNFPGVSTLTGQPMGGWIQYALSPVTSCWLAHHFYLRWKYGMDSLYLAGRAYPFHLDVIRYLEHISVIKNGRRSLPLSSSPEINDNSIRAWFSDMTSYDLTLVLSVYRQAEEMAQALGRKEEARQFKKTARQWPEFAIDAGGAWMIAPGYPFSHSHRHFSHLMAIYPLGLTGRHSDRRMRASVHASLRQLMDAGTGEWCGYSWAWLGNLQARAGNGEAAAEALETFASCFCLPNSFHANGDQSGTGKSSYTYRPFTLEGNFAFAAGIQEMLLQSHDGLLRIFPAVPAAWKDVSFSGLRSMGACIVSATRKNGAVTEIRLRSETGGTVSIDNPFKSSKVTVTGCNGPVKFSGRIITFRAPENAEVVFSAAVNAP